MECHSVQNGYEGKHMVLHSSLSFVKNNPSAFPSIIAAVLPEDKKKKESDIQALYVAFLRNDLLLSMQLTWLQFQKPRPNCT